MIKRIRILQLIWIPLLAFAVLFGTHDNSYANNAVVKGKKCICELFTNDGTRIGDSYEGCKPTGPICESVCRSRHNPGGVFRLKVTWKKECVISGGTASGKGPVVVYNHCYSGTNGSNPEFLYGKNYWNLWNTKLGDSYWARVISAFKVPKGVYARMCSSAGCWIYTDGPKKCLHSGDDDPPKGPGGDTIESIETSLDRNDLINCVSGRPLGPCK